MSAASAPSFKRLLIILLMVNMIFGVLSISTSFAQPLGERGGSGREVSFSLNGFKAEFSLLEEAEEKPEYLEIVGPASNPKIIVNNAPDLSSARSIVDSIVTNTMSDKEIAVAIWKFVVQNRYSWFPPEVTYGFDKEDRDPVKMFNVYGYGFCSESSAVLEALWETAGLNARVWELYGHIVPEVYYDGGWHMLDPDHETYYLSVTTRRSLVCKIWNEIRYLSNEPKIRLDTTPRKWQCSIQQRRITS